MGDLLPTLNLGSGRTVKSVAAGGCALLDNRTLKCWGYNGNGELADGDTVLDRGLHAGDMGDNLPTARLGVGRTVKAFARGSATCAILDNDDVKCWGGNTYGQLGQGDKNSRGGAPSSVGDNLLPVKLLGP
jgi:E3 ubiquitin-protein ligase HERC3